MIGEWLEKSANTVGIFGVILLITAYFLLNMHKIRVQGLTYQLLNLCGACLILFSLLYHWNTASFLIECVWILVSLIGIYRIYFIDRK